MMNNRPPQIPESIDPRLKEALSVVASQLRDAELFRQSIKRWISTSVLLIGLFIANFAFPALNTASIILAYALIAINLWRNWVDNRKTPYDFIAAAQTIEAEFPELKQELSASIEQQSEEGRLSFLQRRLLDSTLSHPTRSEWRRVSYTTFIKRMWLYLASALSATALAILLTLYPHDISKSRESAYFAESSLNIEPGNAEIQLGSSMLITARFSGPVPESAELVTTNSEGVTERFAMNRSLSDPVFAQTISSIEKDLSYKIEYASLESDTYSLKVFELPKLEKANATIDFPDYTKWERRTVEDTLNVSAVEGSIVDYTFNFNKEVSSAVLESPNGESIVLEATGPEKTQYATRFQLEESVSYSLTLKDNKGRFNAFPPKVRLTAIQNEPAKLTIVFPKGDQRVSPIEEFDLVGNAKDDFGLIDYGVGISFGIEEPNFMSLKNGDDPEFEADYSTRLMLEDHDLKPGDLISWYVWADDFGPDGQIRRSTSDIFFSEARSLDEIFRENQAGGQQQGQAGGQGDENKELLDQQREISIAIWNLKQRGPRHGSFVEDAEILSEAQSALKTSLEQAKARIEEPDLLKHAEAAGNYMTEAIQQLDTTVSDGSETALTKAWMSSQGSYQELLRMLPDEYNVSQSQSSGSGRGQGRNQGQLNNLEFNRDNNRYETESQAQAETTQEQREQLEILSKLSELARRQQDINQRLQELQTALNAANDEEEKEKIRRELKRLEEEQRNMLADMDQTRQQMDNQQQNPSNREAREQLDQARESMQRSQEQLEQGEVSQALAAGSRAQENLQKLKEDFQESASSQFSEQMREARQAARELAEQQQQIEEKLETLEKDRSPRLDNSGDRDEVVDAIENQREKFEELLNNIRQISEDSENTEPRLHKQLYDAMREQNQFETASDFDLGAQLLRQGFLNESMDQISNAGSDINRLREEIESAAESVLGNEETALRFAASELNELTKQLQKELEENQASEPQAGASSQQSAQNSSEQSQENSLAQGQASEGEEQEGQAQQLSANSESQSGQSPSSQSPGSEQSEGGLQAGQSPSQGGQQSGQGSQTASSSSPGSGSRGQGSRGASGSQGGQQSGGGGATGLAGLDELMRQFDAAANGESLDPLTGEGFSDWAERLRTVEELLDSDNARERLAQAREVAEELRRDYKRHGATPQWGLVDQGIIAPLGEVRGWLRQELLRRDDPESLQPIDQDPVPQAYQDSVRKYYEALGE